MDSNLEFIPRIYQAQIEEIAFRKNTIIHLPTGSGKTYIAIRLIKRLRNTLQKPWGEGGKRCFFLVNNVPLVNQQKKMIQKLCPVDGVAGFCSEDNVDYWDKNKWDYELSKHQVIVMTSQILHDMITHKFINIEDISLIIFDECHHAVDDHPMRLVMKHFELCPVNKQPRILGLTATLLNSNVKLSKVEETLRNLEITFHATIATANDMGEVATHSTNPHELVLYYSIPSMNDAALEAINLLSDLQKIVMLVDLPKPIQNPDVKLKPWQLDISTDPAKIIKSVKNMIQSMIDTIKEMGIYGGAIAILSFNVAFERRKRWAATKEEELLYIVAATHSTEARIILLKAMENDVGYDKIVKHSSSKVLQLLNVLKEYSPVNCSADGALLKINHKRNALSALILTQQRCTSKILYNVLKDVKEANPVEFGFLQHDFIVGFNINPLTHTREQYYTKKLSLQALLKFKNGDLNCLISTSVLEEGIDVPQCLLVVRYNEPLEYRSYIQSKGRARSKEANFVMLVEESNKSKFLSKFHEFQKIEEYVHCMLHGNISERDAPTYDDIQENFYDVDDIPPYLTKNGVRLPAASAISLLSRYCNLLPHDQFTKIAPMWVQEKVHKNTVLHRLITIIMPISCPVKEPVQGMPHVNLKSAKRSAALNVCIRLHEEGELDDESLLPRQFGKIDFDSEGVKDCFPNWRDEVFDEEDNDIPKPGTKKRVRKHPKVYPTCLNGPDNYNYAYQVFYLHIVKLNTAFDKPKDSRECALYNLLRRKEGYGFLTLQKLPKICSFPMFLTVGEVNTSLEMNYATVKLNLASFELVKQFHFFVFDQVLEVAKKFLIFDGTCNNLYVVPVKDNNGYEIDWEIMQIHKEIRPVAEPPAKERMSLKVTEEIYKNAVVTPWYRGSILPDRYIVSNVLEHMTPQSNFDSDCFVTYADYYSSKYNLEIIGNKDQPLLEVRNISSRMNCLLPRAATIDSFTDKQRKLVSLAQGDDKPRAFTEVFIPEFCLHYSFPGVLWYKAVLLPSIMHRVNMLLVAEELRAEIATYMNIGDKGLLKVTYNQEAIPMEDCENGIPIKRRCLSDSSTSHSFSTSEDKLKKTDRSLTLVNVSEKLCKEIGQDWLPIEVDLPVAKKSLLANVEEPAAINSIDRINNPIDESVQKPLNIMSVKESVYQLQKKKISKQYPWDESKEPIDVDRNLSTVTVMDIECYDSFVSAPLFSVETDTVQSLMRSSCNVLSAAILPPPLKYVDKIKILSKTLTSRGPELRDILAALTTINSHDTFNLERAETLGDAFLKFAASLFLFHKFPQLDEGQLTNIKGRLIGNRNLYYAGERINLGGRMKVEQFSPRRDFVVPGFFAPPELVSIIEEKKIRPTFMIGIQFPLSDALSGKLSTESRAMIAQHHAESDSTAEIEPDGKAQNAMQCYVRAQAVSDKPNLIAFGKHCHNCGKWMQRRALLKDDNFNYCCLETNRQLRITKARALSNLFPKNQAAPDSSVKSLAASTIQPDKSQDLFDDFQSVADCVEALIGTYLMSGGIPAAIRFLEWMRIIPPEVNFKQYLHKKVDTVITEKKATEKDIDWLLDNSRADVEKIINYKFKDPSLLLEALSHASYIRNRHTRSYERLEFLGDAILDFLITSHIFENSSNMSPGDLTDLRSSLVNNVTIASYVVKLGLHKFLCSQINAGLENAIKTFVEHQEEREHEIVEEVLYLIEEEDCNIAQYIDVPKCLSDIFEAIVGAVYLDTGGDLDVVWSMIYRIMHKEISSFSMCIPKQPVRVLMEMIHHCPSFGDPILTKTAVPKVMVPVTFTKDSKQHTAYGVGSNKSQAKRAAAKLALKILAA